ncbi:MAG: site-2 protease family protein, partial [candidate division WOR-3 bacterium]
MEYLIILLALSTLIFIHESGHFLAARLVGIPIEIFSVGFGPKILGIRKGKTEYRISFIPLGGYILPEIIDEKDFYDIPVNKRILFALGGPLSNIFFATLLLIAVNMLNSGFNPTNIFIFPLAQTAGFLYRFFLSVPGLFSNPENVSGVVGIFAQGKNFIDASIIGTLSFSAALSLNLAVLNFLPVPVLDGGKIFLYFLEKINPKTIKAQIPLTLFSWV